MQPSGIGNDERMPRYVQDHLAGQAGDVMKMLGMNPLRGAIIRWLSQHPEGGTSGDIARACDTGYKTVLWHLQILEGGHLVESDGGENRMGQRVIYRLNVEELARAITATNEYLNGRGGPAAG